MFFKTQEGKTVKLVKGDLSKEKVDVIVNTTGEACDLNEGVVSKTVLSAAGEQLQEEIDQNKPSSVSQGLVIITNGANLACKYVYHACILSTKWDGGKVVEPLLRKVVQTCLQHADSAQMSSISIPAIGTGQLNYPRDVVAKIFYEEAIAFSANRPSSTLNEIRYVVYHNDSKSIQSFEDEMQKIQGSTGLASVSVKPSGNVSGSYSTPEGKTVELIKGDIVNEQTDVIVNAIQASSSWNYGAISSAIVSSAGQEMVDEFNDENEGGELQLSDVIITGSGSLGCDYIYHVCVMGSDWEEGSNFEQVLQNGIKNCLDTASKNNMQSIAIPAMGTGGHGFPLASAAKLMFDEVSTFSSNNPKSTLQNIRIVVFHQNSDVCQVFGQEMNKASSASRPSKPPLITTRRGRGIPEKKRVRVAERLLKSPTSTGDTYTIPGGKTIKLKKGNIVDDNSDVVVNPIKASEQHFYGAIATGMHKAAGQTLLNEFNSKKPKQLNDGDVVITGAGKMKCKNVYHVCVMGIDWSSGTSAKCEQVFRRGVKSCLETAHRNNVTSIAIPPMCTGGHSFPLDLVASFMSEEIKSFSTSHPSSSVREIHIVVYDKNPDIYQSLQRVFGRPQTSESIPFPPYWQEMGSDKRVEFFDVHSSTQEYKDVERGFKNTCSNNTVKQIRRIQNRRLFSQYMASKQVMDYENPKGTQNERILYHGTKGELIEKISGTFFNRTYAGTAAGTLYGHGCYFAVKASKAASYAKEDDKGVKHMYQVRVLTGLYTQGDPDMTEAPINDASTNSAPYDSVVDNPKSPLQFVVFNDAMAYPEYYITFL